MFSIEAAVKAQALKANVKAVLTNVPVVSKALAGKSVNNGQVLQALLKLVADGNVCPAGIAVNSEQLFHALLKLIPADISESPHDVNSVH